MAFLQFPKQQYFLVADGTERPLGYFNLQDGTDLNYVMMTIFIAGSAGLPFDLRMNIYGSSSSTTPIFSSEWATISAATLDPTYVNNWLGNIYLTFGGQPLNPNLNYYMSAETLGYVQDGDNFYMGYNLDWYSSVNNQINPLEAGARIRILGKR